MRIRQKKEMSDTIYKLQKLCGAVQHRGSVYQEGDDRINIEIPGVSDANEILEDLGQPGSLYFIKQTGSDGTANYEVVNNTGNEAEDYKLTKTIDELKADGSIVLEGVDVKSAKAGTRQDETTNANKNVVSLVFTDEGTTKFADATRAAAAAGESIGIYYDGAFVSVPNVNEAIEDGQAEISGSMTFEDADALASTIRIGGLEAGVRGIKINVVGAQLGEKSG